MAYFEEKILYKTRRHWIVPVMSSIKWIFAIDFPVSVLVYFLFGYSWLVVGVVFIAIAGIISGYDHYLWTNSWLTIGNQKITMTVRNGIFSQYAMNIRYRNIRDSAVSKNNFWNFLFKYGTLFVRSSANEGDFHATFVPKVGKVYALVNALSRYSDDERARIDSIEKLHTYHQNKEFSWGMKDAVQDVGVSDIVSMLKNLTGITGALELDTPAREWIRGHEDVRNHGVLEVLRRQNVIVVLHNSQFRDPASPLTGQGQSGEVYFPGVPFPEVGGKNVISGSPSARVHTQLFKLFPYADSMDATILVGWDT